MYIVHDVVVIAPQGSEGRSVCTKTRFYVGRVTVLVHKAELRGNPGVGKGHVGVQDCQIDQSLHVIACGFCQDASFRKTRPPTFRLHGP